MSIIIKYLSIFTNIANRGTLLKFLQKRTKVVHNNFMIRVLIINKKEALNDKE